MDHSETQRQSFSAIKFLLDRIKQQGREPNLWEREHLIFAISYLVHRQYGAMVNAFIDCLCGPHPGEDRHLRWTPLHQIANLSTLRRALAAA
jgi:hypothetical protein